MSRKKEVVRKNWWYRLPGGFAALFVARTPRAAGALIDVRGTDERIAVRLLSSQTDPAPRLVVAERPLSVAVVQCLMEDVIATVNELETEQDRARLRVLATLEMLEEMTNRAAPVYFIDIAAETQKRMETLVLDLNEALAQPEVLARGLHARAVREVQPPPSSGLPKKGPDDPWALRVFIENLP